MDEPIADIGPGPAAVRSWPPARPAATPLADGIAGTNDAGIAHGGGERVTEIIGTIELLVRDVIREANAEAGRILESAKREGETIRATAEREASTTTNRARDRADAIVSAARTEAASVATESERLSKEFVTQVQALLAAQATAAGTSGELRGGAPATNGSNGNGTPAAGPTDPAQVFMPEGRGPQVSLGNFPPLEAHEPGDDATA